MDISELFFVAPDGWIDFNAEAFCEAEDVRRSRDAPVKVTVYERTRGYHTLYSAIRGENLPEFAYTLAREGLSLGGTATVEHRGRVYTFTSTIEYKAPRRKAVRLAIAEASRVVEGEMRSIDYRKPAFAAKFSEADYHAAMSAYLLNDRP